MFTVELASNPREGILDTTIEHNVGILGIFGYMRPVNIVDFHNKYLKDLVEKTIRSWARTPPYRETADKFVKRLNEIKIVTQTALSELNQDSKLKECKRVMEMALQIIEAQLQPSHLETSEFKNFWTAKDFQATAYPKPKQETSLQYFVPRTGFGTNRQYLY